MRALAFSCLLLLAGCGDPESSATQSTSAGGATTVTGGSGGTGATTTTDPTGGTAGTPTTTGTGGTGGTGGTATTGGAGGTGGTGGTGGSGGSGGTGGATTTTTTGTGGAMPGPCVWGDDCGPGYYCLAPGCGAGDCVQKPVPAGQSPDPAPVCGCDGVTYWNDEVAASLGMSIESAGACAAPIPCGPGLMCPGNMKCNRQVTDEPSCDPQAMGECWGTALSCPLVGPVGRACTNAKCELQCSLIQSQNPWYEDPTCM